MATDKRLVWMSRHSPTKPQRKALERAGYTVVVCHPPDRYHSAEDMWMLAQNACGGIPHAIVAISTKGMVDRLLSRLEEYGIPIVQPVNVYRGEVCEWTGRWRRFVRVSEEWTP